MAGKVILNSEYTDYEEALKVLGLDTLSKRRDKLSLKFAKISLKYEQSCDMFPLNGESFKISGYARALLPTMYLDRVIMVVSRPLACS